MRMLCSRRCPKPCRWPLAKVSRNEQDIKRFVSSHRTSLFSRKACTAAWNSLVYADSTSTLPHAPQCARERSRGRRSHHTAADSRVGVDVGVQVLRVGDHEHVPIHLVPHTVPAVRREAFDLHRTMTTYHQSIIRYSPRSCSRCAVLVTVMCDARRVLKRQTGWFPSCLRGEPILRG